MALYVQIDEDGNPTSMPMVVDNVASILGKWDFTDEDLAAAGLAILVNGEHPFVSDRYDVAAGEIVKNEDGQPEQLWNLTEISPEEKKNRWIVRKRYSLLLTTDWTQMADSPLSSAAKAEFAAYRQALRDLPNNIDLEALTCNEDVEWPVPPGVPAE